ncbi:MAG: hypothetical protein Q9217_003668 [Psora testacea]
MIPDVIAAACLVWYLFIIIVSAIGIYKIRRSSLFLSSSSFRPAPECTPHITIIRPVKGPEPYLYECLSATFIQNYPSEKLTIFFCLSNRDDLAFRLLERLLADYPTFDAKILIENEDPYLAGHDGRTTNLGPNPKIRNMSRAYREAKGDIVWIVDCNVWVGPDVAGRMMDLLCGFARNSQSESTASGRKYKFVHQLPLVIDVSDSKSRSIYPIYDCPQPQSYPGGNQTAGGLLEEIFLSTSHAKFYTAINTVAVVPCIVGKSNMFRRSHLNALTSPSTSAKSTASVPTQQLQQPGIDYFSSNICEDHLIGDLLWKYPVPPLVRQLAHTEGYVSERLDYPMSEEKTWGNHALLPPHPTNLAIQPTAHLPITSYLSRRIRWLRVRKFTVTLATLVEPGTESFLCSFYGAFALTTLPWCHARLGIPPTWTALAMTWLASVVCWAVVDRWVYGMLQSTSSLSGQAPPFAQRSAKRRPLNKWLVAWLGREVLAFPIWAWAFYGGVSVQWRGRRFSVGVDMRVREIGQGGTEESVVKSNGRMRRE